ncbi:MAG UNVERIFIED_CONTAM: hypothetical protein LVR29_28870 [Microcystis novacekii LVE1205-3]
MIKKYYNCLCYPEINSFCVSIIMNSYQTYLIIDHSQKIILSNLPFKAGTKLAINIQVVEDEKTEADFEALLDKTKGIWTKGDGLEYQQKIREEWI